jgi:hypothetical protein
VPQITCYKNREYKIVGAYYNTSTVEELFISDVILMKRQTVIMKDTNIVGRKASDLMPRENFR